jgi:hypothetical protein
MSEQSTGKPESQPVDGSQAEPIEVGEGPFGLTGSDDDDPRPESAPPSRTRVIVLSSLLAVGLAGAGVMGYAGWRISAQKDATLVAPTQVAELTIDQSENGLQSADYLTTALSAEVDLDKAVGAVYTDPGTADQNVLFFGGTTLIWTPESDLDTAFNLVSDDQSPVTGLHEVDAGKLGGTMKCGSTTADGSAMTVCGWADHGSLALAMFPNRPEADSAALLREIRAAAQTRN